MHLVLCFGPKQIADLASLRAGMHKFEAYYIDNLVGKEFCTHLCWKIGVCICSGFG